MAKDVTKLSDFQFDNDDDLNWSFGGASTDDTNVETVAKAVVGSTIDKIDDDDDEAPTNLETNKGVVEDDKNKGDIGDVIKKPKVEPIKKVEPVKQEKPKSDKKEKEEDDNEEEELEDEDFFSKDKNKVDNTDKVDKKEQKVIEDNEDKTTIDDTKFYSTLTSELKEKGIFQHIELPKEGEELDEDGFLDKFEDELEARLNEGFESYAEKMDEDGKEFIKLSRKGANIKDFVEAYYGSGIDYKTVDLEDEGQRDEILRYYLTTQEKLKGEDLDDRIETLKDKGKADAKAKIWLEALKEADEKAKKDYNKKIGDQAVAKKERVKKFNDSLTSEIDKVEAVNNYPITKEDQKTLKSFFTKPSVKAGKDYVTPFNAKLAQVLSPKNKEDREKLILLGTLLNNDFDFTKIAPKVETGIVRKIKDTLKDAKKGVRITSSSDHGSMALANLFDSD